MLLLDSRLREINGISVFPDHANPEQWYYLPLQPQLSTVRDAVLGVDVPQFLLHGFRGNAGTGGLLNFDCNLGASQQQVDDLAREIANKENLRNLPAIGPVPLVDGTVRLMMLGRQSGDAPATDSAAPEFVLEIDHHEKPALYGINQAAFSVKLDQDGFTVMEQCLAGEIMPVAVVYSLDYLGLRPAYSIRLSVDWDRVQKHLDETFSASVFCFSSEIGKAVDELVESRAIVLESDTFVAEDDESKGIIDRRDAALAQVRTMITDAFFTSSLPPWTPEKKSDWERGLEAASKIALTAAAAAAGGPAAASASSTSFSYKRMDYTRIDKKSLNVNFSERVTVKKSIYPQGHLAALFKTLRDSTLDRERFVRQVSLDNEWFAKRRLKVGTRADFAADDIASINVRARYGDQPRNAILTSAQATADFEWLSVLDAGVMRRDVQVEYEVGFKSPDGAERPLNLRSQPEPVDVENVEVVPRELYTIATVPVMAEGFPWDRYSSVEVHLRYDDEANGIHLRDMIRLTEKAPESQWKMFMLDPRKSGYEYRLFFRALDNRDIEQGWRVDDDGQITVRNPFPTRRVLEIVPSLKWAEVAEAFVDVRYEDPLNNLQAEESFALHEGVATQRFQVDLRDPQRKTIYYKVSISFKDGTFLELPESMTNERRIAVRADMKGRRIVAVRPPANFAARHLRRVTVDLRFEDFTAGLRFESQYVFESADASGEFEYDIVDVARRKYEYRSVILFENGMEQAGDWQASDAAELVIRLS